MKDNQFLLGGLFILLVWTGLIILAPFLIASKVHLFNYLGTIIYFFMDPVCHQLPQRSLFLASLPMPVCARCFSIYLTGVFIFLWQLFSKKRTPWSLKKYLYFALPVAVEILTEKLGFYHNWLELRMLSGILMGIIIFKLIIESFMNIAN
jgi:uncharacterized membrane protein